VETDGRGSGKIKKTPNSRRTPRATWRVGVRVGVRERESFIRNYLERGVYVGVREWESFIMNFQ
jgi:hypothetical protein